MISNIQPWCKVYYNFCRMNPSAASGPWFQATYWLPRQLEILITGQFCYQVDPDVYLFDCCSSQLHLTSFWHVHTPKLTVLCLDTDQTAHNKPSLCMQAKPRKRKSRWWLWQYEFASCSFCIWMAGLACCTNADVHVCKIFIAIVCDCASWSQLPATSFGMQ